MSYELNSPDRHVMLLVSEGDHLSDATIQANCVGAKKQASIAGLTVLDDSQPGDGRYSYGLYTPEGVGYGLAAYINPATDKDSATIALSIMNTFTPLYKTSACK